MLGLCLPVQCMMHTVVVGFYQLNKGYIAKNLCENQDKPELKCCGKCYLRKELKKVDGKSDDAKNGPVKADSRTMCRLP